jgi:hypothetical protein
MTSYLRVSSVIRLARPATFFVMSFGESRRIRLKHEFITSSFEDSIII